jgi:NADH dehydrogenase
MRRVFLTGGGGFIGSRLLRTLVDGGHQVFALDRAGTVRKTGLLPESQIVRGDLLAPDTYRQALASTDIVVHLAAATGRAPAAEHWRINAVGTETLINECRAAGIHRIVAVSSIATTFADLKGYPYALAKTSAERAVERSGLGYVVLRPTMVLGPGSPILDALARLASLPVIPVFGSGRTPVQPVHVDDVAGIIRAVVERDRLPGETIDVGGQDVVSIEELLQQIRIARTGRRGPVWHVPLGMVLPALNLAEAVGAGRLLPFSVGQLATFRFPGIAAPHPMVEAPRATLQQMVSGPPVPVEDDALTGECRVFTRHLIGSEPPHYVTAHYARAHRTSPKFVPEDRFDRYLVRFAARHPVLTRLADSYARVFVPASLLRRKLVLLLAVLETAPQSHRMIDRPPGGGLILVAGRLVGEGLVWLVSLVAGIVLLVPARLAVGRRKLH